MSYMSYMSASSERRGMPGLAYPEGVRLVREQIRANVESLLDTLGVESRGLPTDSVPRASP